MTTLSAAAATTALMNETGESLVVLPTSSPTMPQTSTTCSPPPATTSTGDAMMCDDHDVNTDDNDTMMHHPTNDTASYTNALHDAVAVSGVSNSTSTITRDESTQGALDALATLAAASPLHATNHHHHHHGEESQEITPHLTSGSSDNDDDSEIMPPPPPRNPTTLLGSGGAASTTSVSFLQDNASMSVSNHGIPFLHDVGTSSSSSIPSSCTIAPISTGRLRSASNPEGMEKWDYYSRRNDRQHFVLPSSILEEELASTRRVLGEAVDEEEDYDDEADVEDENNGEYKYNNNNNGALQHGFFSPAPQTNYGTEQLLQPMKKDGFQQHWVRRSQRSSAGKRSDSLLGTSPDSVSDSLDNGVKNNNNGSSNNTTATALTRSKGGAKSKVTTTTTTASSSTTTTNKASATSTIKKKSTTTKNTKKNSRLKSSQSTSQSPQLLISTTDQTKDEQIQELDESQLLEPEELLRRARSRLLEDLSEGNSNSSSHGGGGDKGSVLMLPHSLSKYKEVYNKNGRIGIYTPAERAAIIQKFNAKRARRVWNKKIRYNCRKNLADRRMRVKGRFVKRSVSEATSGGSLVPPEGSAEKEEGMGVTQKANPAATNGAARSNSPPTSGSPLTTVNEHGEQQEQQPPLPDEEMPDVDDVEAGFDPSEDMPYRRTRRYTIT